MQIGFKHDSWYGARSEARGPWSAGATILRNTVMDEIPTIRLIAAQYLKHIEDELRAQGIIDGGGDGR